MQDYTASSRMPNMQPSGIYDNRMMTMPEQQLENMYPQIYHIVNPIVIRHCDMMDNAYGPSYIPTRDEMERMTDNILMEVGRVNVGMPGVNVGMPGANVGMPGANVGMPGVNVGMPRGYNDPYGDPMGDPRGDRFGDPRGDGFLRDLIGILLIRELLGRRRRFRRFRSPGFFPGF